MWGSLGGFIVFLENSLLVCRAQDIEMRRGSQEQGPVVRHDCVDRRLVRFTYHIKLPYTHAD